MKYNIDEQLLRKYYLEDKLSVEKCAEKFGCSSMPIRRAIREYNIPKRNISESLKELFKDKTKHPKYGTHWSKDDKKKISNSQPYKGKHIQTNTGRTHFKKGHECTPAMIEASKQNIKLCIHPNENLEFETRVRNWLQTKYNWYNKVFERDNYTCWVCGKRGGCLHAHHTTPFIQIIEDFIKKEGENMDKIKTYEELITLRNGITLCAKCHRELHWG